MHASAASERGRTGLDKKVVDIPPRYPEAVEVQFSFTAIYSVLERWRKLWQGTVLNHSVHGKLIIYF